MILACVISAGSAEQHGKHSVVQRDIMVITPTAFKITAVNMILWPLFTSGLKQTAQTHLNPARFTKQDNDLPTWTRNKEKDSWSGSNIQTHACRCEVRLFHVIIRLFPMSLLWAEPTVFVRSRTSSSLPAELATAADPRLCLGLG